MTDKQIKEETKHINTRNQEYIAENNRMTEKIIDGLSCDNCPDAQRCQEQQTKKEYAINQVLQDIPSEYANVIDRLKQIIPSITRCDYVLEKQLKRKKQECEKLKKDLHKNFEEKDKLHLIIDRLLEASGYDTNTASAEDFEDVYENMRYEKQQLDQLKQALTEIKEISENVIKNVSNICIKTTPMYCIHKQIIQKISEVENERN